ncbi:hypothetical protein [Serratia ureilytica]|uniref:hypothetical protein n=1 Tax=Serratia ureilytica TaxID=300181 RepID=UPI0019D200CB|nr:hypothetical protein [Serratia ureilytica]MBN5214262.1 hypothetical protein [Serratia ureilytica]
MRINVFNNSKSGKAHSIKIFLEESLNHKINSKAVTIEHKAVASDYKALKKCFKSDKTSPTRMLHRFVTRENFDKGEGTYFAGSLNNENFIVFVDTNWTKAVALTRKGRSYEETSYELVIADKEGRFGTVYNASRHNIIDIESEEDTIGTEDFVAAIEVVSIKDEQIAKLQAALKAMEAERDMYKGTVKEIAKKTTSAGIEYAQKALEVYGESESEIEIDPKAKKMASKIAYRMTKNDKEQEMWNELDGYFKDPTE